MAEVRLKVSIPLAAAQAFDTFVEQMDTWWPRQGVFPYSFAPAGTRPLHIRFEPGLGGRYYETFADNSEYTIGHISLWQPPTNLTYSWRDPNWQGETEIQLHFAPTGEGTQVLYQQDGFARAGVPELAAYYQIGCRQTLSAYVAHCQALWELAQLS